MLTWPTRFTLLNSPPLHAIPTAVHQLDRLAPWSWIAVFLAASLVMIWRLEHLGRTGIEGTVLGTLVMPYCSGIGNLVFVFVVAHQGLPGSEVVTNALVNNVTNLTLLIGLPALIWGGSGPRPGKSNAKGRKTRGKGGGPEVAQQLDRLSVLFTLVAVLFFTGALWILTRDRRLSFEDGLVLVGLFVFWQCVHVFEVLKTNARERKTLKAGLVLEFAILLACGYAVYESVQHLVGWLSHLQVGFVSVQKLGWLSGWLMVLPNAILALYYGWKRKPEVLYTSQVGDAHVCIPLAVGLTALLQPAATPAMFTPGMAVLGGAVLAHLITIAIWGRLTRWMALGLVAAYGWFVYSGLLA